MDTDDTPKKTYTKSDYSLSSCRICLSVGDLSHRKKLFSPESTALLNIAEKIYGKALSQEEGLPKLICRPCVRRLTNTNDFAKKINDSQEILIQKNARVKRCLRSSAEKPKAKTMAHGSKAKRTLFDTDTIMARPEVYSIDRDKLTDAELRELILVIQRKNVQQIVKTIFNIPLLSYGLKQLFLNSVNNELKNVCRNKDPSAVDELQRESSILQDRDYNSLKGLTWEAVIQELEIRCPTTLEVISSFVDRSHSIENKLPVVSLIYSLAALSRNPKMSRLQRINSMLLTEGNASSMLHERLNKYGICLGPTSKYRIMDEIGEHHLDKAVELVKNNQKFVIVIDNIDWTIRVHDAREDQKDKSVHAVASCLVFDRVSSSHLSDASPSLDNAIEKSKKAVKQTAKEIVETRSRYRALVARILTEFFPALQPFTKFVESHIKHEHEAEAKQKSVVVNLPIIMKDEKKYSECVDIMDQLESWIEEIMNKAHQDQQPVPSGPGTLHQLLSYQQPLSSH